MAININEHSLDKPQRRRYEGLIESFEHWRDTKAASGTKLSNAQRFALEDVFTRYRLDSKQTDEATLALANQALSPVLHNLTQAPKDAEALAKAITHYCVLLSQLNSQCHHKDTLPAAYGDTKHVPVIAFAAGALFHPGTPNL